VFNKCTVLYNNKKHEFETLHTITFQRDAQKKEILKYKVAKVERLKSVSPFLIILRIIIWLKVHFFKNHVNSALKIQCHMPVPCQQYTPTDCFFGDFIHWVIATVVVAVTTCGFDICLIKTII